MAQSPEQLVRVKKETNSKKLQADANIYRQQAEEQKAIAVEAALQNGWPITIETENNFAEIQRLDENGNPVYYTTTNSDAAITTSTNKLYSGGGLGLGLSGSGMTVGEWDGAAVFTSHEDFNNTGPVRVTQKDAAVLDHYHATHVAGTLIGGGLYTNGVTTSKGMAYSASLDSYDWNSDYSEMATAAAAPTNLLVSNHSYGYLAGWVWNGSAWDWYGDAVEDNLFGYYDSGSATLDGIAVNAPYYLIVKSAGNDRGDGPSGGAYPQDGPYDCIPGTGNAKNILTIGATKDVAGGYSGDPNDVEMTSFSSWGPADDGRIKPDICGNGYGVISAYWDESDPSTDYYYASLNGTSMSAPNVTGSLLLLQEHFYDLNSAWMKSATLKALAVQTADECGPDTGPDYMFGWGLLNAETAANVITNRNVNSLIKEETYSGTAYTITVTADGTNPLRATLVWTDPAGTPPAYSQDPANIMLVNDLDMTITGAKSTYYPYNLDKDNPSNAATTGDNDVDNVEQIHIALPTATVYTISITHEGSISGENQNFSLIVTGIDVGEPAVTTYEPADITATSVTFSGETTSENGNSITERGFVYGTSINPDINDSKVVVGSGLGTFNTSVGSLNPNKTYHVRAYATNDDGTGYGVDKDFTTTSTTTWNGSSWDGGAPTASIHAVIDGTYTTSGDLACNNLTINSGKTFNLSVNDGVTVNGDFVNNGTFNIKSTASGIGSLITLGTVSNSGTFNMERYVSDSEWHLVSVPMSGKKAVLFNNDYLQYWNEPDTSYYEITSSIYPLELGKGYALWTDFSKSKTYTWTGTPYTGSKSTSMSFTDFDNNSQDYEGANLMGNIFPSSIDWSTLDEVLYGSVYYFNGTNYSSWNSEGGVNGGTKYIPPGQGFFVIVDYAPASLSLGNANRTHFGTSTYWKSEEKTSNGVKLLASGNNLSDEVLINFREDASTSFEKKYDAYKFKSGNAFMPEFSTIANETRLSIDRRPETNIIQLGFSCQTNGNYSINISEIDGLTTVELEDTKTQKMHDLKAGAYTFDWVVGDAEERFKLHLSATSTQELSDDDADIYASGDAIFIRNINAEENSFSTAFIYNLNGQLIHQVDIQNDDLKMIPMNQKKGIYVVHLIGENQQKTEKVIIK